MESSRTRDFILDWLIAATLAAAAISGLAGIDADLGAITIRSHGAWRILAATAILAALRIRLGIASPPAWLTRLALLTAIAASVGAWLRFLLTTIGGADSYGYVSAAHSLARGRLVSEAPLADWLTAANRMAIASPLGWTPSPDGAGIVPAYPLGMPMVMALFELLGGPSAVFVVAPCMGLVTLLLVYRLARRWYDADTALFATALVAWNPLIIAYAKQPMSDIAATMWIVLALYLAVRATPVTALGAGLAAGAAVMTRPALLIAAAAMVFMGSLRTRTQSLLTVAGLALVLTPQMAIQYRIFGSPFSTGYGSASDLFSLEHAPANLSIFASQGLRVVGWLWVPGLILGLIAARPEPRAKPAMLFAAVALPYVFYLPFDHWETLRFLLPGLVPLTIPAADGLMHLTRWPRNRLAAAVIVSGMLAVTVWRSEALLRASSVWDIAMLEERYPLAAQWVQVNTPEGSVILANQHSGSLRWYGARHTLRWDFIAPDDLEKSIGELEARGAAVFAALEGPEAEMFDARFAGVIGRLRVDHVGRIRNVQFRRLTSSAGSRAPDSSSP
jgi:hypothetical protein